MAEDRDPAIKNRINRLKRWLGIELKERRKNQLVETLKFLNFEDQSVCKITKRP